MSERPAVRYESGEGIARITLDRPERGNGITPRLLAELVQCVERADLDPAVHVLLLSGNGAGFCGGYDLVESAEGIGAISRRARGADERLADRPRRWSRPTTIPPGTWDPMVDYAMMSRNVRAFMTPVSLRQAGRLPGPRLLRGRGHRHGAVLGPARDRRGRQDRLPAGARVGVSDDRRCGPTASAPSGPSGCCSPATACPDAEALEWGLAIEAPPAGAARGAHRDPARADRAGAAQPVDDDEAARQPEPVRRRACTRPRCWAPSSTASPATPRRATPSSSGPPQAGFRQAVRERDEPFGDAGALDLQGLSAGAATAPWRPGARMGALADVAQLARASPCHGEGRGFESLHPLLVMCQDIGDRCLGTS